MALPAAVYSRSVVQRLAPPAQRAAKDQRKAALALIKDFQTFAEVACGCTASSNRVNLRRAVFHATQDIDLAPLVELQLNGDMAPIESIARMECPVTLPDKTMLKVKVKESAPKRIVYAAKALRRHVSLTETQTCRGCGKRSRCRFFKAPAYAEGEEATTGVRHVGRVVFGMAQYARAHLQEPEAYPFYFTKANLDSARVLMRAIAAHLAEEHDGPLYGEIERASMASASEVLLREAQKKTEKRRAEMEERVLALPEWMRETLQPVPCAGMTRMQRSLAEAAAGSADEEAPEPAQGRRREEEGDEAGRWFEEGDAPGEPVGGPLAPEPTGEGRAAQPHAREPFVDGVRLLDGPGGDEDLPITNIDGIQDLPVPQRFRHKPASAAERQVVQYNSLLGGHTSGVFHLAGEELGHRIDLDGVAGDELQWEASSGAPRFEEVPVAEGAKLRGGYAVTDLLSPEAGPASKEALSLVSLSPGALEGVHRYNTGVGPKPISPKIIAELWERTSEGKDELPFLTRIPFDSGPGRSGGSLPPSRLPRDLVLGAPQPIVPPPSREPRSASGASARNQDLGGQHAAEEEEEAPGGGSEEDFARDEALARRAMRERAGQAVDGSRPEERQPAEAASPLEVRSHDNAPSSDQEDRRFAAWSGRQPPRTVGVLNPSVDFGSLADAGRAERSAQLEENVVALGQRRPLPRDEAFVSAFRRPLSEPVAVGEDGASADPLGAAAPGIDLDEIRSECSPLPAGHEPGQGGGLEEEGGFIMGGSIKFPTIPEPALTPAAAASAERRRQRRGGRAGGSPAASAPPPLGSGSAAPAQPAAQRLPPRLGRVRQARLEDLSDLLKPGAPRSPSAALPGAAALRRELGQVSHPDESSGGPGAALSRRPRSADEVREERNTAMAAQLQLYRQTKSSMQKQYPASRPFRSRRGAEESEDEQQPRRRSGVLDLAGR